VIAPEAEFARLAAAREQLGQAFGERPVVELVRFAPAGDVERQQSELLSSKDRPVVAVLTGGLERPSLTGDIAQDGTVAGQVGMLIAAARAPGETPKLAVTTVERSARPGPNEARSRSPRRSAR
jgi:hypothetical protein